MKELVSPGYGDGNDEDFRGQDYRPRAGTRITVFDVVDYLKNDWHRDRIAALFRLSSRDVQAAIDYIAAHRPEVEAK